MTNLLAVGARAGVKRAPVDRRLDLIEWNTHYAGKRLQEDLLSARLSP